ncbi:discoidin domain-containing protein [Pseudokineococcus marinus]|uniref:Discoidin domain-containing protein n=2 Tax=Pseudokineococcus marinus TaxID=351215 RepID=A0A849BG57_9ACTN|nr:discoidin domain-containing protein [Pseudokineococcus marinus]
MSARRRSFTTALRPLLVLGVTSAVCVSPLAPVAGAQPRATPEVQASGAQASGAQVPGPGAGTTTLPGAVAPPSPATARAVAEDPAAQAYYAALLRHTRWSETQWDEAAGVYRSADFSFAVVLGNAVLLTRGEYDAEVAGVEEDVLRERTLATIRHYAASNRLAGGAQWGDRLFWDSTFQSYFTLAAHLMWPELDQETRDHVDAITSGQAERTTALGTADDPRSGSWTPNGLTGGFRGDTKLEEMGVYAQSLAPGIAWGQDEAGAADWRAAFGTWSRNESGLPAADRADPALVDGVPVSENTAHNIHDTFAVENHGSFGPHYQEELWRTSGRNAVHLLLAGAPLPEVLTSQPNGEELWRTILGVMSDAGEPLMPMVDDREHLYGRDVIPLAFLAQVQGDRYAAAAERALAERLEAYQAYAPADRLTKFSGEPKYEPEARAEVAISYLLHEWRASAGDQGEPASMDELFAAAAGTTDHGDDVGLLAQQSPAAWAGSVSKPGYAKFAWQPGHDDWLFDVGGKTPSLLPSTGQAVEERHAVAYSALRDGFDGTASLLTTDGGRAGMTTLPTGTVVYATSGTGEDEGRLRVHNLTMPGMPGLDGDRTYTTAEGETTLEATDVSSVVPPSGVARVDRFDLAPTTARYVRMQGVTGDPTYGYSLFELEAGAGEDNAALGAPVTASSADGSRPPSTVTDGDYSTRWAVSRAERSRGDSWVTADLGEPTALDHVTLYWESAAGRAYRVQTSSDGRTWTDVATYGLDQVDSDGGWLAVDDEAGLVVRGSDNPITVRADQVVLSDGPAAGSAGMVVEGYAGADAERTAELAARPAVTTSSEALAASDADGYLSLFNLSDADAAGVVQVPAAADGSVAVYAGVQTTGDGGTAYETSVPAATSAVRAPRFTVAAARGGALPDGLLLSVGDGQHLVVTAPAGGRPVQLRVTQAGTDEEARLTVPAGRSRELALRSGAAYPLDDLALGRTTFPTSPLPEGMSDPGLAVDGDDATTWRPGPSASRMVVDLGEVQRLDELVLQWASRAPAGVEVSTSTDGLTYTRVAAGLVGGGLGGRTNEVPVDGSARYVAVSLPSAGSDGAALASLEVRAG